MKKLIIFDCDGVLVDSEIIRCEIDAKMLTALGYTITTEVFIRHYAGISDQTMVQRVKEDTGITIPESFLQERLFVMLKAFETRLKSLIKPILVQLYKLGILRCIASGSQHNRIVRSLEITEQMRFFDEKHIFNAEQVEKGKPAPDLFLFAAKQMGVFPEDCLVIEDSLAGIQAAQAAGMEVLGFLGGAHAHYNGYRQSLKAFNIPFANSAEALRDLIKERFQATV